MAKELVRRIKYTGYTAASKKKKKVVKIEKELIYFWSQPSRGIFWVTLIIGSAF